MITVHPHFSILYHSDDQRENIEELIEKIKDRKPYITFNTSGSTGVPKRIKHKKTALTCSARKTINYFQLIEKNSAALCLSVEHIAGAMMLIRSMVGGLTLHVFPTSTNTIDYIKSPIDFIAMVPMQLESCLTSDIGLKNIQFCGKILVGGAPITHSLDEVLVDKKINAFHSYGMTETITHVAIKKIGFLGNDFYKTLEGISVGIIKECLCINYPEISNTPIETNDRVELIDQSSFRWLGRLDHVINSGGIKMSPEILENKISKGINTPFILAGIPDRRFGEKLVIILQENVEIEKSLNKDFFSSYVDRLEIPKSYCIIKHLEWNKNNKIDRSQTLKKAIKRGWEEIL